MQVLTIFGRFQSALIKMWTQRTGEVAARHYLAIFKWWFLMQLVALMTFAAFTIASFEQIPVLHVVGFVLMAIDALLFSRGWYHVRRFRQEAEKFLGVHVRWYEPPSTTEKFARWCRARGIEPGSEVPS